MMQNYYHPYADSDFENDKARQKTWKVESAMMVSNRRLKRFFLNLRWFIHERLTENPQDFFILVLPHYQ